MPKLVNLKVAELRKNGYKDVNEWLSDPKHLYIGRRMRIFVHTGIHSNEQSGTKVARDEEDQNKKILIRPSDKKEPFDEKLLCYPVGSYVNKKRKIVHLCIIPQSEWHNPFKVKQSKKREKVVDEYEKYLCSHATLMQKLSKLGQYSEIGCWCTPKACHGDTILAQYKKLKNNKRQRIDDSEHLIPCKKRKISNDCKKGTVHSYFKPIKHIKNGNVIEINEEEQDSDGTSDDESDDDIPINQSISLSKIKFKANECLFF